MATPFEKRLQNGPIVVADGGMGTLISGAVPRLRFPEEANLPRPKPWSRFTSASSMPAPT